MKTLIIVLIIASLLEATILPINLVLIILICRSYLKSDKTNLFFAFFFGLLDGHLKLTVLGLTSLSYLLAITIVASLSKSRLSSNAFLIVPVSFSILLVNQIILNYFTHQTLQILKVFFESLISLPIFFLIKGWEERFIVRKEIKLKI